MAAAVSPLPDDVGALKALLAAALQRADEAEARAASAVARESAIEAVIAHLKLQIAKLRREQYGASAERSRRLLEQMELQLEDLEAEASAETLPPRSLRPTPPASPRSSASGRSGSRSPSTCRASVSSTRRRARARPVAARACQSSART